MVNENMKQEQVKNDLQKQLEDEKKKTADLEKINKEKSQTKIHITKMPESDAIPEATADGSATDKFLQNFADSKQQEQPAP